MKIIVLDTTTKTICAALSSAVATSNPDFVVAYADTSDNTFSELSSDGQLNGTTDVTLVGAPASGVKRTIKSISVYNRDTAPVIVVIKLDVSGTQRILQRVQLVSGETWHSDELTKQLPGGSDTQVQFNDGNTLAGSSNFTYNKTTSVLTLGANPILTAGTANGVLYLNGSKSATTGSALTFDGTILNAPRINITNTGTGATFSSSSGSGLRIYGASGTNQWDLYLNGANVRLSDNTGGGKFVVDTDATIYGVTIGRGAGAVATNTAVGASALAANTTGSLNTAVGYLALTSNTTGYWNTAVGRTALSGNTTGFDNTAIGLSALTGNTSGSDNSALGLFSLQSNTTGSYNTAVGTQSLNSNTTASNNTAVGYQAGYANVTGAELTLIGFQAGRNTTASNNTFVGTQAAFTNTTGTSNTAIGRYANYFNTTGSFNTSLGESALQANTTGGGSTTVGYRAGFNNTTGVITAVGYQAGISNSTAGYNSAFGLNALYSTNTGDYNTAIGRESLYSNTTASSNTAVGYQAGYSNTTGIGFTAVGREAGYSNTTASYGTYIGNQAGLNATGTLNTFVGWASGFQVTTGSKNTIIGGFGGNQGGLDIRTSSNNIVLSDGDGNPRAYCNSTGVWAVAGATVNRSGAGLSAAKGIGAQNDATARFATIEYGSGASGSFTTITIAFAVDSGPASVILEVLMTAYSSVYLDHVAGRYGNSAAVVMRNNASAGTTVSTLSVANVGGYDTYTLTITTSVTHPVVKIKATVGGLASGLTGIPTITFA